MTHLKAVKNLSVPDIVSGVIKTKPSKTFSVFWELMRDSY